MSTVSVDLNLLESMSLETVSFEELLGHVSEVYKKNESDLLELQNQLKGVGYVPGELHWISSFFVVVVVECCNGIMSAVARIHIHILKIIYILPQLYHLYSFASEFEIDEEDESYNHVSTSGLSFELSNSKDGLNVPSSYQRSISTAKHNFEEDILYPSLPLVILLVIR